MLQQEFLDAVKLYRSNDSLLWREIETQYNDPSRHYHTLVHLEYLLEELSAVRSRFREWSVVVFAIAYHDIVYKASKNNNEEKSAELAETRLKEIDVPEKLIVRCKQFIFATKRHEPIDEEIDLFTDADLSILGAAPVIYDQYTKQVRREYSIYPDLLYKPGRKKVLLHFLEMKNIFKSSYFREKYETQARANMQSELTKL